MSVKLLPMVVLLLAGVLLCAQALPVPATERRMSQGDRGGLRIRLPGYYYSRLDLPPFRTDPGRAPSSGRGGFAFRFGPAGSAAGGGWAAAAHAVLFSFAAVNAFAPAWLPSGLADRWGLSGTGLPGGARPIEPLYGPGRPGSH